MHSTIQSCVALARGFRAFVVCTVAVQARLVLTACFSLQASYIGEPSSSDRSIPPIYPEAQVSVPGNHREHV